MPVRAVLACLVILAPGCASLRPGHGRAEITADELLAGAPLGLTREAASPVEDHQVLAVSAEMRDFLDRHVARGASSVPRLRQLGRAILNEAAFGLRYDETTRTAAETFHARRGNCLSFSNMFVAMARHAGLKAYYQEVDTPPDWSLRNDALILNRHVNVLVDLGNEGEHVVDFNIADFRTTYERRRISDARALAHHYNNVAVERMQAGDAASAFSYFRHALERDPSFSPAWTNLGILYLRKGHPAHAEAAYLQALSADPRDLVAMSNLAALYERRGDHERAARYRGEVIDHRNSNPYYRFQLAREALLARDYEGAIGHLKYAVSRKKNEDQFYFLLGVTYLQKGDERAARRWLSRAEGIAASGSLKRRYASKIERLLSPPPEE
jgi:Flp pilus assembly protein TadD